MACKRHTTTREVDATSTAGIFLLIAKLNITLHPNSDRRNQRGKFPGIEPVNKRYLYGTSTDNDKSPFI